MSFSRVSRQVPDTANMEEEHSCCNLHSIGRKFLKRSRIFLQPLVFVAKIGEEFCWRWGVMGVKLDEMMIPP